MIPRVRLKYVQGLEAAHEDLHLPCDVDLTTDGERLIVSSARSGRPLLKVPPPAVEKVELEAQDGLTTAAVQARAGLTGREQVLVVQLAPANGVPEAATGHPIVFASPDDKPVAARVEPVKRLLVPRTRREMERLEKAERRMHVYITAGILIGVLVLISLLVALFLLVVAPRQQTGSALPAGALVTLA